MTDQNDNPSAEKLQRLAEVLELDPAELLAYIGVQPSLPEPRLYSSRSPRSRTASREHAPRNRAIGGKRSQDALQSRASPERREPLPAQRRT